MRNEITERKNNVICFHCNKLIVDENIPNESMPCVKTILRFSKYCCQYCAKDSVYPLSNLARNIMIVWSGIIILACIIAWSYGFEAQPAVIFFVLIYALIKNKIIENKVRNLQ